MSEPLTLPILPLRELVLFPGITMPIAVGRPSTLRAIEAAKQLEEPLVLALTQRENTSEVTPEGLYQMGTIARIEQVQRSLSGIQVLLHAQERGAVMRIDQHADGYLVAVIRPTEDEAPVQPEDPAFVALYREAQTRAAELAQKSGLAEDAVRQVLSSIKNPARFADLVAGYVDLPSVERQGLLETLSVEERLRRVLIQVQRQLAVMSAQEDLQSKIQAELGDRQKEIFLREQMKAIQKELGEGDADDEIEELRRRLEPLDLPAEARKEVDRELKRLQRMGREASEAQVIRTFLDHMAELPWNKRSTESLDMLEAERILDEDHYGLGEVKDRILEFLAVRQLRLESQAAKKATKVETAEAESEQAEAATVESALAESAPAEPAAPSDEKAHDEKGPAKNAGKTTSKAPILLFIGPPGVGKTSLAKSIARAMGREYVRISLGGARDEADIRGHRRTYVGAMPGRILKGMKQAGTKNPVFLLDEIDKLGTSYQGDPSAALLEVLDPAQNDTFVDHYLGVPFDLSEVLFICTANFVQNLPGPLLDRMEVIEFSSYTEREKLAIARQYLLPRQLQENGLDAGQMVLADDTLQRIISEYTREAGVRQLEREIGRLARKIARKIASRQVEQVTVEVERLGDLLGRPKVHPEKKAETDQIGVATAMYYTPVGGDIMFVEATTMPGKGELVLTGQLGDVMKESARAAWSYARAHAAGLHIKTEDFLQDVHVHVPAGAIPKDGPSAGVTMATALVSTLSKRPVRHDIAMTGEITLNGRVLPIGGVKEKVLGGVRAGIRTFILPEANEPDLEDLPQEVREMVQVVFVKDLAQVLALALRDASIHQGRLLFPGISPDDVVPLTDRLH